MTPASTNTERSLQTCEHTGLTKPECHCPACVRALIAKHRPAPPARS
jgi:hypothetical protein